MTHKTLKISIFSAGIILLAAGSVYLVAGNFDGLTSTGSAHATSTGDSDDHDHEGETDSFAGQSLEIMLSETAAKNMGIDDEAVAEIALSNFYKTLDFPALVTEIPGWSIQEVPAPASGVISKIHHESGVSVMPGEPLFEILLNQQDVVKAQTDYLSLLKKREINAAETERLSAHDFYIVQHELRLMQYEKMQNDLDIEIQKKALMLLGLKEEDIVETLENDGKIIRSMTITVPAMSDPESDESDHAFTLEQIFVTLGQNVSIGSPLARLSDYCELTIQGKAFAINEKEINRALENKSRVRATFEGFNGSRRIVDDLFLRSADNRIDGATGTLLCYVDLKNQSRRYEIDQRQGRGQEPRVYNQWTFKPGQRCELNIAYETISDCIVLPVDAVAKDMNEMVVFEWVGSEDGAKIWRKTNVHVLSRSKDFVAIANDGSIYPGAKVASKGAGFILAALDASNQRSAGGGGGIQHGDHVH